MRKSLIVAIATLGLAGCGASSLEQMNSASPVGLTESDRAGEGAAASNGGTVAALPSDDAQQVAERIAKVTSRSSSAYLIGVQDVLQISVFKVPDLSKTLEVSDAGTINFPLLGDIEVAGRTARNTESLLKERLEKRYLQNAQVTVTIREFNSQRVTMDGAFKKPGVYPLRGRMSLLQAISGAQGMTDEAENEVLVFRAVNGKRAAAKFDVSSIRSGDIADPEVKSGDVVVANTSATQRAFNNLTKVLPLARFMLLF